jgi:hypothetical protein
MRTFGRVPGALVCARWQFTRTVSRATESFQGQLCEFNYAAAQLVLQCYQRLIDLRA